MQIFILKYKDGRRGYYTTLSALCEENSREDIGVSLSTLQKRNKDTPYCYENEMCKVEKAVIKTRGDILREREQPNTMRLGKIKPLTLTLDELDNEMGKWCKSLEKKGGQNDTNK
jgi:hypothetical protein